MRKANFAYFLLQTILGAFWSCWIATLLSDGMSFQEACIAAAFWFAGIGLFEVPTGWVADRYGRKLSTICGVIGLSVGFLIVGLADANWAQWAALGIAGVSVTMVSGACDAWLYNLETDTNKEFNSESFWIRLQILGRLGIIVGGFGGVALLGVAAEYLWIGLAVLGAGLTGLLFAIDAGTTDLSKIEAPVDLKPVADDLRNPVVRVIFLTAILFGIEAGIRNVIYQPYVLEFADGNLFHLAYFQALLALARLGGLLFYKYKLMHYRKSVPFAAFSIATFGAVEIAIGWGLSYTIFLGVYVIGVFCLAWYFPIRQAIFNEAISENNRARLLSVDSMLDSAAQAVICLVLGIGIFGLNADLLWLVAGVSLVLCGSVVFTLTHDETCMELDEPNVESLGT